MSLSQSFASVAQSRSFQYLVYGCEAAMTAVCIFAWLAPATRTPEMHGALTALWMLPILQYCYQRGFLTKTLPQVYQSYRRRVVPANDWHMAIFVLAAVTDAVWRLAWWVN